jgi:tRNA nucleotidyltransferase/poly(A) polymerase
MNENLTLPRWPLETVRAVAAERDVRVWPVGGVVRDALLDRPLHDWDFAVDRDARGLARAVGDKLGGAYFPLDPERDVGRVVLGIDDEERLELDFAALRGPTLAADLGARDFTINAMAVAPEGYLLDPYDGQGDLERRLVRAIGPQAFDADPLRMLRGVRQVAELRFRLEAKTAAWIIQRAPTLSEVASERVREEVVRILAAPNAAEHVHMLDTLELLPHVLPDAVYLKSQAQSLPHRFDVWWHTLLVIDGVEGVVAALEGERPQLEYIDAPAAVWDDVAQRLEPFADRLLEHLQVELVGGISRHALLRLAALCHDLGKPLTVSEETDGRLHFYGHEREGAELTEAWMEYLAFSRAAVAWVKTVVMAHLRPGQLSRVEGEVTRRAVYRYFRDTGPAGVDVTLLSMADHLATYGPTLEPERWTRRLDVVERLLSHYFERYEEVVAPPPLITGRDLMAELDLAEGPLIGRLLAAVREAQASGEVGTRQEALALAGRLLEAER